MDCVIISLRSVRTTSNKLVFRAKHPEVRETIENTLPLGWKQSHCTSNNTCTFSTVTQDTFKKLWVCHKGGRQKISETMQHKNNSDKRYLFYMRVCGHSSPSTGGNMYTIIRWFTSIASRWFVSVRGERRGGGVGWGGGGGGGGGRFTFIPMVGHRFPVASFLSKLHDF